jgi:trimeric autotransporter adhesin
MRKLFLCLTIFSALGMLAQSPRLINYQGALRDLNDAPVSDKAFSIRFRLLQGTNATPVFVETQTLTSDPIGLFATQIGKNNPNGMAALDLSGGELFLLVSIDTTGGNNYANLGEAQRMGSVPFSLYALTVPSSYSQNVLVVGDKSYTLAPPVQSLQGSGEGVASVTSAGLNFTVNVPAPSITANNNTITLQQGTVVSSSTVGAVLTLTGPGNNTLTAGANAIVLNTYTAGPGLNLSGVAPSQTLSANTTGTNAIWSTLGNAGTGAQSNFIGTTDDQSLNFRVNNQKAGTITNNSENTMFGYHAGNAITSGSFNTAVGSEALSSVASGIYNTATGNNALTLNTGDDNSAFGFNTLQTNVSGVQNSAVGSYALFKNTTGDNNSAVGKNSMYANISGSNNSALGTAALDQNSTGSGNTAIGSGANVITGTLTNASAIGSNAKVGNSNSMVLGDTASINVGVGTGYPTSRLHVRGAVRIEDGTQGAGKMLTSDASGNATWQTAGAWGLTGNVGTSTLTNFIGTIDNTSLNFKVNNQKSGSIDHTAENAYFGYQSGLANSTGTGNAGFGQAALPANNTGMNNAAFGHQAMNLNSSGSYNTGIGQTALLSNSTGSFNTALGFGSMRNNTSGISNLAVGNISLRNNTTGSFNTAVGPGALFSNTTGINNTGVGYNTLNFNTSGQENTGTGLYALFQNTSGSYNSATGSKALQAITTGSLNTAIGYQAGYSAITGTGNVFLGANAGYSETGSNKLYIANTNTSVPLIYGDFSTNRVGINTNTPTANMQVNGTLRYVDGNQAAGKVLTTDANGNASWQVAGGGGWSLTGNAGTNPLTNFIGTTDNFRLSFRTNSVNSGHIDPSGPTFLGYQAGITNTISNNSGFGYQVLQNNSSGFGNTGMGYQALRSTLNGWSNSAFGYNVLIANMSGYANTAIGYNVMTNNNSGEQNTAIGVEALELNTIGFNNTAVGFRGLEQNTSGTLNTAIGFNAGVVTGTLTNATAIGAHAKVHKSNSLILGDTSNVLVGIGTGAPTAKLDIRGQVRIVNGTQGTGRVLTSDASGNTSWQAVSTSSSNVCYIKDVKSSGISGGNFTSLAWQTRDLNTVEGNSSLVTLAANQFTLQAGTYIIRIDAPAYAVAGHKAKLRNITDAADAIIGRAAFASNPDAGESTSIAEGMITITSAKVFQVQHYCNVTQNANGFGGSTSMGVIEVYTQLQIIKLN